MIHLIKHTKGKLTGKFDVIIAGDNGEVLNSSRQGFTRRADAIKDMRAVAKNFSYPGEELKQIVFQDETKKSDVFMYSIPFVKPSPDKADLLGAKVPRYVAGKNKKKK